ncbi:aminotransferase class I/II-fold pyridoxal phosphate-dependent enzyme [Bacillus sp. LL01]|uniref:aminotransferase class I/II-fold pyridoxal phosphate-dependent enzyme n=1 Tax=Bacillus sp. LL01 TaxID=1665556 RepID=UPI00069EA983|nr:aminotransferase class I/II-fold pyridoxal phosphate-dependent enzyme [Bacillus sp. LL01]
MKLKYTKTPLIDAIQAHFKREPISLHVPGHKNGELFHSSLIEDFKHVHKYDVTELEGLDDLHDATGAIHEAEQAAARFYHAGETLFLVGGSTVGNLAMVKGLCEQQDQILIQRNSHKSLFNAIELFQVEPIFLTPELEKETGHALGPSIKTVERAVQQFPKAKALFLTYPTYYGATYELKQIIKVAHAAGMLVCVDEAHGAHFVLGEPFPPSALLLGADIVVQSAHKMLPALTMGSYLHFHHNLAVDSKSKIKKILTMLQSSSPSYLIMAALDGARAYTEEIVQEDIDIMLAGVQSFINELATIPQLKVIKRESSPYSSDPLKVTIKSCTTLTGFELQRLFYDAGVDVELADDMHLLLVFGLTFNKKIPEIINRIKKAVSSYAVIDKENKVVETEKKISMLHVAPHQMKQFDTKKLKVEQAEGYIAAEAIIPYPPGIPLIFPGEKVDNEVVKDLKKLYEAGAIFQGTNPVVNGLEVLELEEVE